MSSAMLLPTAVVGSYSMPGWLERVKNDYLQRRISRHDLDEIHDTAVKAAIKDQEVGGRRHRLRRRAAARQHDRLLRDAPARRADRPHLQALLLRLLRQRGPRPDAHGLPRARRRFPLPAPVHRSPGQGLGHRPALARQADPQRALPERGGLRARHRAGDEPRAAGARQGRGHRSPDRRALLLGLPRGSALGHRAPSTRSSRAWTATIRLHICYGNRYGKPSWEGSYRYLFPAILEARIDQLMLEFGRRGEEDVRAVQGVRSAVRPRSRRHRREDARRREPGDRRRAHPEGARDRAGRSARRQSRTAAACTCPATSRSPSSAPWWRARGSSGRNSAGEQSPRRRARRRGASATSSSWSPRGFAARPSSSRSPRGSRRCPTSWPAASRAMRAAPWATTRCASAPRRGRAGSRPTST